MESVINRLPDESFDDYFVRLFETKGETGLTCEQIADLLNPISPYGPCGESKWRKSFKDFQRGRLYERNKLERGVARRILCVSDLHIPYQLPIDTFRDYANGVVDDLVVNGDVCDFSAISKFPKVYRSSPMDEIIKARVYLIKLIEYIKPKRVIINYGNHDIRFQNYLAKTLDSDIIELMPQTELDLICNDGFHHYSAELRTNVWYEPLADVFADDGIEILYSGSWYCSVGKTLFCHPLAFKGGPMKTSQDAVTFFRNDGHIFDSLVMGHTHRTGSYTIGNTIMYEEGACCDTSRMHYADGKLTLGQKEGFLYLCQDADGSVMREQTKLVYLN